MLVAYPGRSSAFFLLTTLLCTSLASAQNTTTGGDREKAADTPVLENITVTGSRTPRAVSDLATSVSQIDHAELAEQLDLSTNILESFDVLVPGLTTSQEEARSGCRTNIRGRPAQFLINGIPTNDNLRRSNCGSLYSLSPFALERVEVLRGATALFGAGAPGGAINLLTRRANSQDLSVDLVTQHSLNPHETNDSGESNVYLGAGQALSGWDYYAGVGVQDYGVRRNPDGEIIQGSTFRSNSFNGSIGVQLDEVQSLHSTILYYNEDPQDIYGTDFTQVSGENLASEAFIATPPNPHASEAETEQQLLTLAYDNADFFNQSLNISLYWHEERLIQRAADFWQGDVYYFDSDAENERRGLRSSLNWVHALGNGSLDLTYGLDLLQQRYYRPIVDPANDSAVIGFISPEVLLDSAAVFVQPQYRMGDWLFTAGVRHEEFDGEVGSKGYQPDTSNASTPGDTPDFDLTLYNLGLVYDLNDSVQVFGGFSQGAEISEFGRAARGVDNPSTINLEAAASNQYEVGVRGSSGELEFSLAAFYSHSDKAANLQADPSCVGEPLCPLIPLRLEQEIYGTEITADWQVHSTVRLGSVVTWQKGEFNERGAKPLPFGTDTLTPLRTSAYAALNLGDWLSRVQASYHASTNLYNTAEEAAGYRDADSVFLVDVNTSYPVGPGVVSLGVTNLLNEEYVNVTSQGSGDFYYYLSEGTRATLGYTVRF